MWTKPVQHTRTLRLLALMAFALPLAACGGNVDRSMATATMPEDYHQRHPVALATGMEKLDVFVVGYDGRLDRRQLRDVRDFADSYKRHGQGKITAMVPSGTGMEHSAAQTLDAVRHVLAGSHIAGSISVGTYQVANPRLAAPVQLSFPVMEAQVHNCGEWPEDLASGSSADTFSNKSYYNMGCATQKTFAAQIDDPRDLVRPRSEDPSDVSMRTRAIGNIRTATDPGTSWTVHNTAISSVGSN